VALRDGGLAPYLPGQMVEVPRTASVQIRQQLDRVWETWLVFRRALEQFTSQRAAGEDFSASLQTIEDTSIALISQTDSAVRLFEAEATRKLFYLRVIQAGFFACALALLGSGAWWTRKSVLAPLKLLKEETERIGAGDLSTPVRVAGLAEIDVLSGAFQAMQDKLSASQTDLRQWAETLEQRVVQRTRELDALYEISREISSRLDIRQVLESVTSKARMLLSGEVAVLCLLDESNQALGITSYDGPAGAIVGETTGCQAGFAGEVITARQAQTCEPGRCEGFCSILSPDFQTSHLAAPLWAGNHVIGALCVGWRAPGAFSEEAVQLLTKLANSAAVAIENARLYAQAERVAALEERQRIAADMHDSLGQTLSYLGLSIDYVCELLAERRNEEVCTQLERARQAVDQATREVRTAISHLVDETPPHQSLQDRLKELVREFKRREASQIEWSNMLEDRLDLPGAQAEQVLRVASEALSNACRHSAAKSMRVELRKLPADYVLVIADNGQGFDPGKTAVEHQGHFGLQIMQARAALLGGQCLVESQPGHHGQPALACGGRRSEHGSTVMGCGRNTAKCYRSRAEAWLRALG
jgi:two-component system nitrate/nitrite sensor histidine kinase NarX